MAQTVTSSLSDVMKEVFTASNLVKQFYDTQDWLSKIEKTDEFTIGNKAVVPIHKGRSGGITITATGGTPTALNSADKQKVDRAEYTINEHWAQVETAIGAYTQAAGGDTAAVEAVIFEVEGAQQDLRNQIERIFLGNGDALIAQCTTTSNSATINLLSTGYGPDAIERGWLYPGLAVDIGTTANEVAVADGATIQSVAYDIDTPSASITVDAAYTTSSSHYVSIKNARAGTTSYEGNGLRTIAGSTSTGVGGLDPDTTGEEFWKPARVSTNTTYSLDEILRLRRATHQIAGKESTTIVTSLKQLEAHYQLLQSQVQFSSDSVDAGGVSKATWNGSEIFAVPAVPNRELYVLNLDDFLIVHGKNITGPTWASDLQGAGKPGMLWRQGYNSVVDGLVYPCNLGIRRRNSHAANCSLTA